MQTCFVSSESVHFMMAERSILSQHCCVLYPAAICSAFVQHLTRSTQIACLLSVQQVVLLCSGPACPSGQTALDSTKCSMQTQLMTSTMLPKKLGAHVVQALDSHMAKVEPRCCVSCKHVDAMHSCSDWTLSGGWSQQHSLDAYKSMQHVARSFWAL